MSDPGVDVSQLQVQLIAERRQRGESLEEAVNGATCERCLKKLEGSDAQFLEV